ncbi:mechanosensitive ion channel family protein [Salinibius halmophilus]|uniref:mechanosensitive ion channel family protein n=1 Tax=Salinibius halmophilus TaxID=1853216 RepID=UPI000E66953E|nr:mechanosensitive ion channel domain-containing protein [Salinibius halmophilus]
MLENIDYQAIINDILLPWGSKILMALVIFFIGRLVAKGIVRVTEKVLGRSKLDTMIIGFITSILSAVLILIVIIAALEPLGVDTTSLVALIGAAGLAIGLALQDSLKNFAAGFMLILFRPFKEGDFIEAGGATGVAEKVSILTTIMRTVDNREIIVPNGNIFGNNITNFSARDTRRVDMVFGIGYDADLKLAKQLLCEMLENDERVLKDPAYVVAVSELADSSVNFVVRPWVKSSDYWPFFFDMQEQVKLRFDEAGVSIPFPQMDVHIQQ